MPFRFNEPAEDFADGVEVLRRYHEAFLAAGRQLLTLAEQIAEHGIDVTRAAACLDVCRYYVQATALHHRDEEKALFPLLVNHSFLMDGMMERLVLDHEEIEAAWDALAQLLTQPQRIANAQQLLTLAREFEKLQREHLVRENEDFLPQVEIVLGPRQNQLLARKMIELRTSSDSPMSPG